MPWTARITGDLTLSILDRNGFKVLGVDMLRTNTMRAGDGGERRARTLNDLTRAGTHNPRESEKTTNDTNHTDQDILSYLFPHSCHSSDSWL
jgi:hypothetical protein